MVTLERRIGLLRYRKVYFPNRDAVLQIGRSMRATDVVRVFAAPFSLEGLPNLVKSQRSLTTHIDLSVGPERILGAMKRKSCRYEIRRAETMLSAVEIETNSPRALRDFLPLYNSFAKAKGPVPTLSKDQFHEYAIYSDVFVLYHKQRPLCCHLFLRDLEVNAVRLLYSGSRRFDNVEDAARCGPLNRYLHWYEMQRYCAEGILIYDFGGMRSLTHSTAQFKLSFGGAVVSEYYSLLGGTPWLTKLGGRVYERFFKSAAPALSGRTEP